MKNKRTVRHTLDELPAGRIDRDRVLGMTPDEIERIALNDADNPPAADEELAVGILVHPNERAGKVPIYIRLDADVVEFYKSGGRGYQTRINADLRAAMRRHKVARVRRARTPGEPRTVFRRPARAGQNVWLDHFSSTRVSSDNAA